MGSEQVTNAELAEAGRGGEMADSPMDTAPCDMCGAGSKVACSHDCPSTLTSAQLLERFGSLGVNNPWPITLGHAIARFCRRAEVDALREALCDEVDDIEREARDGFYSANASKRFAAALDRLAALAKGGEGRS